MTAIAMILTSCMFVYHHLQLRACHSYTINTCRCVHFERCSYPFKRALSDFYRENFHESRNKKLVPSLPNVDDGESDAVYILRSHDDDILAALRLTKSKNDGKASI